MTHCTFCPLLCAFTNASELDDCRVRQSASVIVQENQCFVQDIAVTFDQAIDHAVSLLCKATHVCLTGQPRSIQTSRSLLKCARALNGMVDLNGSQPSFDWIRTVQSSGFQSSSIAEVRLRSDLVLIVGDDRLIDQQPRLLNEICNSADDTDQMRTIVLIGEFTQFSKRLKSLPSFGRIRHVDVPVESIPALMQNVANAFTGSPIRPKFTESPDSPRFDATIDDSANQLVELIRQSKYATFVWSTATAFKGGEQFHQAIVKAIQTLSADQRVTGMPISGTSNTFAQVSTWQSGFPGRFSYFNNEAIYDPLLFSLDRFIDEASRSDGKHVLLSVQESVEELVGPTTNPPERLPTIELGISRRKNATSEVFIPIAFPGVDSPATFFRSDNAVAIYIQKIAATSKNPTAASVLERLISKLQ